MQAASGPRGCCVCGESGVPKYRCPACRARYCSVPCYKQHKEQCVPRLDRVTQAASKESSLAFPKAKLGEDKGSPWSIDDILTEDNEQDRVSLQKLTLLEKSEELKGLLLNPHLQQLLLTVDQAEDKNCLMKKYMQEPLFVEFSDCCLRIVEPPEKENILPE
uniref:Zinc finger HIT-type containing 3 n=1 Tax=Sphenodon punctatus TaxID=8508 RepID=A0A8D0G4H1_SPHPU